jgi:hypothetical protein
VLGGVVVERQQLVQVVGDLRGRLGELGPVGRVECLGGLPGGFCPRRRPATRHGVSPAMARDAGTHEGDLGFLAGRGVDVVLLDDPGWSEDTGGRWAAAPARVTPGRAADT